MTDIEQIAVTLLFIAGACIVLALAGFVAGEVLRWWRARHG